MIIREKKDQPLSFKKVEIVIETRGELEELRCVKDYLLSATSFTIRESGRIQCGVGSTPTALPLMILSTIVRESGRIQCGVISTLLGNKG